MNKKNKILMCMKEITDLILKGQRITIVQTVATVGEYKKLEEKNCLPLMIILSDEENKNKPEWLNSLYRMSFHTFRYQKNLYTIEPTKLSKLITRKSIRRTYFIESDNNKNETAKKILEIYGGNHDIDSGGFTFDDGYMNLDKLCEPIVTSKFVETGKQKTLND